MTEVSLLRIVQHWNKPSIAVVLLEKNGPRRLVFFVDMAVGSSIVHALGKLPHPRPSTHELLASAIAGLNAQLKQVIVSDWKDGIFFAKIILESAAGMTELDARPSDAVALAVAADVPIWVEDHVFGAGSPTEPPTSPPAVSILWPFAKPPPLPPQG